MPEESIFRLGSRVKTVPQGLAGTVVSRHPRAPHFPCDPDAGKPCHVVLLDNGNTGHLLGQEMRPETGEEEPIFEEEEGEERRTELDNQP